jgi:hypothetical protein
MGRAMKCIEKPKISISFDETCHAIKYNFIQKKMCVKNTTKSKFLEGPTNNRRCGGPSK